MQMWVFTLAYVADFILTQVEDEQFNTHMPFVSD